MTRTKSGFYAVRVGREPGVYATWNEASAQVQKFPGAVHKKFVDLQDAELFVGRGVGGATTMSMRGHGMEASGNPYSNVGRGVHGHAK